VGPKVSILYHGLNPMGLDVFFTGRDTMDEANLHLQFFNNREKAVIIWSAVFFVWALSRKEVRILARNLLHILFCSKVTVIISAMLFYVSMLVLFYSQIHIWNALLIKETVFWLFGAGFVVLLNATKTYQESHFFRNLILDNLKVVVLLEFISNLYAFGLPVELVLVPMMVFIVGLQAVAESEPKYLLVKKVIDVLMAVIGLTLLVYVVYRVATDFSDLATLENLRGFLYPLLMTLGYLPFLYLFGLFLAYESLFTCISIFMKRNDRLANFTKRRIFTLCHMNIGILRRFRKECSSELVGAVDEDNVVDIIRSFKARGRGQG
jgi:hypothetical protein